MKIIKQASGKKTIRLSKAEWEAIGRKSGWMRIAQSDVNAILDDAIDALNKAANAKALNVMIGPFSPAENAMVAIGKLADMGVTIPHLMNTRYQLLSHDAINSKRLNDPDYFQELKEVAAATMRTLQQFKQQQVQSTQQQQGQGAQEGQSAPSGQAAPSGQ